MNGSKRSAAAIVFSIVNLVFAGNLLLWIVLVIGAVIYGVLFSGDPPEEIFAGVAGGIILGGGSVVAAVVYLIAGIGMLKGRPWGYYFHIAGAILASCSCIGFPYTILAMIWAFKGEFKNEFFGEPEPNPAAMAAGQEQEGFSRNFKEGKKP